MNQAQLLLLTGSEQLQGDLCRQLIGDFQLLCCDDLSTLKQQLAETVAPRAVLVHVCPQTVGSDSAGRFMKKLMETVRSVPVYALLDDDCPTPLRDLAQKSTDRCLALPLDREQLQTILAGQHDLSVELDDFWTGMPHKILRGQTRSMITFSPDMFGMIDELSIAAKHDVTVLLIGETGCGKTYLARLIHEISSQSEERFATVACGALPPDLIESELFGYVKGAFTGADANKQGKFAAAGKGTLLLDEIDVLPLKQQAKLLRVMETGEYEPVGSNETQHSQARLIVASNYNLQDLVRAGTFRTDLFYRLNVLNFLLPPLRERPWDIEFLARQFAVEYGRTHNIPLRHIDAEMMEALRTYPWPGNIRELENVIRRAVLYCQRGILALDDLPSAIRNVTGQHAGALWGINGGGTFNGFRPKTTAANGAENSTVSDFAVAERQPTLEARIFMVEQRIIEDSLRRNNHRRKDTAAELGISRVTLYNKMKKFGLLG